MEVQNVQARKTGTTTVGVACVDGAVLVTEKKATLGNVVDSKEARKVYKINELFGVTTAGSVGDVQAIVRYMRAETALYRLQTRKSLRVRAGAVLMANILQGSKYFPYLGLFLVGGHDDRGPQIFSVDPFGGLIEGDRFYAAGSGMDFAMGVLEEGFKDNMKLEEGIRLALRSVRAATKRDVFSGGDGFWVAVIDDKGYRELSKEDIDRHLK